MKRTAILLLIVFSLFSCSKEKQQGIVGSWTEEANYVSDGNGNFNWQPAGSYPAQLHFSADGKYQWIQYDAMQSDTYSYTAASGEVILGSQAINSIKANQADAVTLIIDRPVPGEKTRFRKN